MADQLAGILEVGFHDTHQQNEETSRLIGIIHRVSEFLPHDSNLDEIYRHIARILIEESNFDHCSIAIWDSTSNSLSLKAAFTLENLLKGEMPLTSSKAPIYFAACQEVADNVFTTQHPVFIQYAEGDLFPRRMETIVQISSLVCLPVRDLGVIILSSRQPCQFDSGMKRTWELIGKVVSLLLHTAECMPHPPGNARKLHSEPFGATRSSQLEIQPAASHGAEHLLDCIPQGACILDAGGKVVLMNEKVETPQGTGVSDLQGRSPALFFQSRQVFDDLFGKVKMSGKGELSDVSLINSKGEAYLADISLARIEGEEDTEYLLLIYDVTQKREYAGQVLQSEKLAALGTMAAGVAHDFNNLLMAVLGNIQLILPSITDDEVRGRLGSIERAVLDGASTVKRLQRFIRRDKELPTISVATNVNETIEEVMDLTRPRWKNDVERDGRKVDIRTKLEPEGCWAAIDPSNLREVLTNLIFNSVEAMPAGGTINIASSCLEGRAIIELTDTGIGMSEEVRARIFDPFYSTKGVTNSGLGLSVSWGLVVQSGGEVRVKSKVGKGTTFTIQLPMAYDPSECVRSCGVEESRRSSRILLVDDDDVVLDIMRDMLRLKGHSVVSISDGKNALELIDEHDFDLVLTDLGMPNVSGWEIAGRVKARDPDTPVILVTGWGSQYEKEDVSHRGVDLVLSKPVTWENLVNAIEKLL